MFFIDLLFALIFALVVWFILGALFGRESWGFPFLFLFLILFSLTWLGGVWITPIGVAVMDSYWLSFLIVALFLALMFAAIAPRSKKDVSRVEGEPGTAAVAIGAFFWLLMLAAFVGILIYYVI